MEGKSQSLERGLSVLDLLDRERAALGVREIARRLDLSPSIVQRIVHTLCAAGYLRQDVKTQRYGLGYRALSLGASLLSDDQLVVAAMPELRRLADRELNAFLGVITHGSLRYALTIQSNGPVAIKSVPGAIVPFHSTAMGKAMLADLPEQDAAALLEGADLERFTEATVTDLADLMTELKVVRGQGYGLSREENLPGVVSAGACVRNAAGRTVAGISVAYAPRVQPAIALAEVVRDVVDAATAISERLGCPAERLPSAHLLELSGDDAA